MKKLFTLLFILLSFTASAQLIRGVIVRTNACRLNGSEGYKILKQRADYGTFIRITNDYLKITGGFMAYYKLDDRVVDSDGTIHYWAKSRNKLYTLAIRECEGKLLVAILPMNGDERFIEYVVKPFKK